ncbi:MAG: YdiU family protein [Paracoccaceae bacterium]
MTVAFDFDNTYARLPDRFFHRQEPTSWPAPRLIRLNRSLAETLGLDPAALETPEGVEILAGRRVPEGAEPLAMAYAGHQFGGFSPQLGDGRALLLGEIVGMDGVRRDVQLKGSGKTPFSRMGDGRAAIGPVLREYVVSEGMHALGVPTTRALAAVATGDVVVRETPLPGAVLVRIARGHVRVGTFQYFYARQDVEALRLLTDYVLDRHHPGREGETSAHALLDATVETQAALLAQWMSVGFIHGVMNTDNMSLAGETIDYGPCAFMEAYHPGTVYSSIDAHGRYAYGNQPKAAHWNLAQLAQSLLPLMAEDPETAIPAAQAAVDRFPELYETEWRARFAAKLGLAEPQDGDGELAEALLTAMAANRADFTLTFRALSRLPSEGGKETDALARDLFVDPTVFDAWAELWRARLAQEGRPEAERQAAQASVNPLFIPRNHLVEEALSAAEKDDLEPLDRLLDAIARPFDDRPELERHALPAAPEEAVTQTFCGT